jgi:putative glutamine amidotransferase
VPVRIAVVHRRRPNDYVESVARASAEPVVVDWSAAPSLLDVLSDAQGLLLSGGADVNPALYGEPPHPAYQPAEPGRDWFETELIRLAIERDVPLLAICRGAQILNVVCGGTLWQDIPSEVPTSTPHQVNTPRDARAHVVEVAGGTRLAALLGQPVGDGPSTVDVNSRHHQAVKHVAPGFVVSARAPDGLIEGIERPESHFCLGVQWHPENFWRTGEFLALFRGFVEACETPRADEPRNPSGLRNPGH